MKAKKWIGNALFLLLVIGLTIWFTLRGQDVGALLACIQTASPFWCAVSVLLVVLFILGESVILYILMRTVGQPARMTHCFLYSFTGFFFSCITPSASGGQPMQLVLMKRDRIEASVSVPVLILVAILYKLVLVLIGLFVLLVRPAAVMACLAPVIGWCWLGVGLNVVAVSGALILVFHPDLMRTLIRFVVTRFGWLWRCKNPDRLLEKTETWIAKYRGVATCFRRDCRAMAIVAVLTLLQRMLLFAVTWCCCLAFGAGQDEALTIVTLQGMIAVAVDMLPLPGGSGISEALFLQMFRPLLGATLTLPVMVLSRGIGFYAQMFIGAVLTAVAFLVIRRPTSGVSDDVHE